MNTSRWLIGKKKAEFLTEVPKGAVGFIYMIKFATGEFYIGRKNFYSVRRIKVKDRKNRKIVTKESNWRTYETSSKEVQERIINGEKHTKEIVHLCDTKVCLMYFELKEHIMYNVLCDPLSLNKNVFLKIFKCAETMEYTEPNETQTK